VNKEQLLIGFYGVMTMVYWNLEVDFVHRPEL